MTYKRREASEEERRESKLFRQVIRMFDEDGKEILRKSGDSFTRTERYVCTLDTASFPGITDADLVL